MLRAPPGGGACVYLPIPKPPPYRPSSESPHCMHHATLVPLRPYRIPPSPKSSLQFLSSHPPYRLSPAARLCPVTLCLLTRGGLEPPNQGAMRSACVREIRPCSMHTEHIVGGIIGSASSSLWCLWWRLLRSPPQRQRTILKVTCRLKHFGFARHRRADRKQGG